MKRGWLVVVAVAVLLAPALPAQAADFGWMRDFSLQARQDLDGFRARLATRFKVGDAEIRAVMGNLPDPADAYMAFRLGEISHHPPERVVEVYKANQGKGWGAMAQALGIQPGSKAFHALKKGHDLGRDADRGAGKGKKGSKGGKGKDRGKERIEDRERDGREDRERGRGMNRESGQGMDREAGRGKR